MDKCLGCHFYDRQVGKQTDSRGVQWGQCRRMAPMLHPINQKSFMIEGVWPHVRDDDWCGEWRATSRRVERAGDSISTGPLLPVNGASPFAPRTQGPSTVLPSPAPAFSALQPGKTFSSSRRGDD